ncbi:hypothetical protein DDQ41_03485 [Streptomyces spongiicola]|uniref:Uncharacterized protein n=1 Tax=Streptomyces spongiicola TaxID=1690221 RepID=A0ABN5KIB3_9ACTN|nr:hypothetical protein DDQ41_03485 [Streptomyces spongiicola]
MPSLTVVVSSDTDICFSPGLYGHCLPTLATGWAPDSFRTGPGFSLSCSHMPSLRVIDQWTARHRELRHIDTMDIVKVT